MACLGGQLFVSGRVWGIRGDFVDGRRPSSLVDVRAFSHDRRIATKFSTVATATGSDKLK